LILAAAWQAFNVLRRNGVNVQMISQGASKVLPLFFSCLMRPPILVVRLQPDVEYIHTQVNISLVVHDSEAKQCVQALHSAFFENGFLSEVDKMDVLCDDFTSHSKGTVRSH